MTPIVSPPTPTSPLNHNHVLNISTELSNIRECKTELLTFSLLHVLLTVKGNSAFPWSCLDCSLSQPNRSTVRPFFSFHLQPLPCQGESPPSRAQPIARSLSP